MLTSDIFQFLCSFLMSECVCKRERETGDVSLITIIVISTEDTHSHSRSCSEHVDASGFVLEEEKNTEVGEDYNNFQSRIYSNKTEFRKQVSHV